jgi:hypothetical protein
MCKHLIRLRPYLSLHENEGYLSFTKLSNPQSTIVEDLTLIINHCIIVIYYYIYKYVDKILCCVTL